MFNFSIFEENLMYSIEDKNTDFELLINLNDDSSNILEEVYISMLNNKAKLLLNLVEYDLYSALESILENNDKSRSWINSIDVIYELFRKYNYLINMSSRVDLENLMILVNNLNESIVHSKRMEDIELLFDIVHDFDMQLCNQSFINDDDG